MIQRLTLPIILGVFVLLALAYSVTIPLGEAPDEVPHFFYIQYLAEHRSLPPPEGPVVGESHQPPLYYFIGALATAWIPRRGFQVIANPDFALDDPRTPNLLRHDSLEAFPYHDDVLAWHLARVLSIVMGAVTVWATWQLAREIFPDDEWIAFGAAAFVAFLPGFLSISAVVNNDNLITLLSSLSILQIFRMTRRQIQKRDVVLLGILLGLAVLSKLSGFVIWLFVGIIFVWITYKEKTWKNTAIYSTICFSISSVIIAPWVIYNLINYGDPLGWSLILSTTPVRETPMAWNDWADVGRGLFTSFWGRFGGAVQLKMSNAVYALFGLSGVFALLGWLGYAGDARNRNLASSARAIFVLFSLFWLLMLIAHVRWTLTVLGTDEARQFFPGLALCAIFFVAGLARLFQTYAPVAILVFTASLFGLAVAALFYLNSIYALSLYAVVRVIAIVG